VSTLHILRSTHHFLGCPALNVLFFFFVGQVAGLDSIPFVFVGEAQSLLMNGRGEYNCSLVPEIAKPITGDAKVCNATSPDCAIEVFEVEYGKLLMFITALFRSCFS